MHRITNHECALLGQPTPMELGAGSTHNNK